VKKLKSVKLIELYILDIIEDRRKAPGFSALLSAVAWCYKNIVRLRNALYDMKILKSHKVPACVVSIGNIVSGGTGKTPLIQYLSSIFSDEFSTAIVTRGYRSAIEKSGKSVNISSSNGPIVSPAECGDEPFWLAMNTKSQVFVGKDKLSSARNAAIDKNKIIFIDDGMQHRRLSRDFEIVLIDGNDPWGKGHFLPRGLLRDLPERLSCADLVVVSNLDDPEKWQEIKNGIIHYTGAPVIRMTRIFDLHISPAITKVGIFCGIAKPQAFEKAVLSLEYNIVDKMFSPDHILPSMEKLKNFARRCKDAGAQGLICTEKDFVKIPKNLDLDLPIFPLRMGLVIAEGSQAWSECMEKIRIKGRAFI